MYFFLYQELELVAISIVFMNLNNYAIIAYFLNWHEITRIWFYNCHNDRHFFSFIFWHIFYIIYLINNCFCLFVFVPSYFNHRTLNHYHLKKKWSDSGKSVNNIPRFTCICNSTRKKHRIARQSSGVLQYMSKTVYPKVYLICIVVIVILSGLNWTANYLA